MSHCCESSFGFSSLASSCTSLARCCSSRTRFHSCFLPGFCSELGKKTACCQNNISRATKAGQSIKFRTCVKIRQINVPDSLGSRKRERENVFFPIVWTETMIGLLCLCFSSIFLDEFLNHERSLSISTSAQTIRDWTMFQAKTAPSCTRYHVLSNEIFPVAVFCECLKNVLIQN